MARILSGELPRPKVYISKPPMLPATINMRTAEGPMKALIERGDEWEAGPGIVNVSVFGGFPFADFDQAGTSIIVTATDPALGQRCADEMGRYAWSIRDDFLKSIPKVPEAVEQALQLVAKGGDKPVVLADVADNPGGGGSGDTTELLRELIRRGAGGAAACVWDPAAVQQAMKLGIGGEGTFEIGGHAAGDLYGAPIEVQGRVVALSDGSFTGWGPVVRGRSVHCGPTARIDVGGLKLVVVSIRQAANDQGYFRVVGIQPERERLLVIKSRGHFRADFEPIAQTIIEVDAPGAANPNLERFEFQHVRRPIWPLDRDMEWDGQ
jgi:microcystin degradation protein MlrC